MSFDHNTAAPSGQAQVFDSWRSRSNARGFMAYADFDFAAIKGELAHVSVLSCEGECFRFRLAGTGLQAVFGLDAKGKSACEIEACHGQAMWYELAARALARLAPVSGMARLPDGGVHYWLRLPMSSDGVMADLVLCHDRYLPADALANPDLAAQRADRALRRDVTDLVAA